MSTSNPPLIFGWHACNDVSLVDRLHHLQPGLDLLGLALAEGDHAAWFFHQSVDVFHVLDQDFDLSAGQRQRLAFFPLVAEDDAFALVAHVDQHDVALDAEHASLDDFVQFHLLGGPGDFVGGHALERVVQFMLPFLFAKIEPRIRLRLTIKNQSLHTHQPPVRPVP